MKIKKKEIQNLIEQEIEEIFSDQKSLAQRHGMEPENKEEEEPEKASKKRKEKTKGDFDFGSEPSGLDLAREGKFRITRGRLQQIIQEEVRAHRAKILSEDMEGDWSLDKRDEYEEAKDAVRTIIQAYGMDMVSHIIDGIHTEPGEYLEEKKDSE